MKVRELIERLQELPADLPVVHEFEACGDIGVIELLPPNSYEARGSGYTEDGCVVLRGNGPYEESSTWGKAT